MQTIKNNTFKQSLFNVLHEIGLIALESEMNEIIRVINEINNEAQKPETTNKKTPNKKNKID